MLRWFGVDKYNPFKDATEYYKHIAEFFETKANKFVENFIGAIPSNDKVNDLHVWNDTGSKPAIRIEFHVDVTNTFKESITYSVKETKNGSYKYTVSRCVHYEKKTFTSETSALDYVHDVIGKIYAE